MYNLSLFYPVHFKLLNNLAYTDMLYFLFFKALNQPISFHPGFLEQIGYRHELLEGEAGKA